MRILTVADEEAKYLYDFYQAGRLDEYDLILACGDLSRHYLEFLVTLARCPVLYVHGNHDEDYDKFPPEGCECIEDRIYVYKGIRILGLGGSYKYRDGSHMYSEGQMHRRILRLWFSLWRHKGFDILMTHAPAYHINDLEDLPHRGFRCFVNLLERYKPKYFIHGHVHRNYGVRIPRVCRVGETTVINAFEYYAFDYQAAPGGNVPAGLPQNAGGN